MKDIPDGCGTVVRGGAASVWLEATGTYGMRRNFEMEGIWR